MADVGTSRNRQRSRSAWQSSTNNGRFDNSWPPNRCTSGRRLLSDIIRGDRAIRDRSSRIQTSCQKNALPNNNERRARGERIGSDLPIPSNITVLLTVRPQELSIPLPVNTSTQTQTNSVINISTQTDSIASLSLVSQSREVDELLMDPNRNHTRREPSLQLTENVRPATRECDVCMVNQPVYQFYQCYSDECLHEERTICDTCVYYNTKSILEEMRCYVVICPEPTCIAAFNFDRIHHILDVGNNVRLFEQYDRQVTHRQLEQMDEFVWCAHGECGSGQLHDKGSSSNPMVICIQCRKRTCAFHRSKWHTGMTCDEYDQSQLPAEDKTQVWLKKFSKKCPKCQCSIEKNQGCDHMTCRQCHHEFCWECFADYRQIQSQGLHLHQNTCSHYHKDFRMQDYFAATTRTCTLL